MGFLGIETLIFAILFTVLALEALAVDLK